MLYVSELDHQEIVVKLLRLSNDKITFLLKHLN
jgi:hypothetical protein